MSKVLRISDIIQKINPVSKDSTSSYLYDRFSQSSDLMVVAVVNEGGEVLGLLERHTFNLKMAAEYGRALFGNKSVSFLMDQDPLLVDCNTPLRDFMQSALQERPSELLRGFVATRDGRYEGVGTSLSILRAISQDLNDTLATQAEMMDELLRLGAESQRQNMFLDTVIQNIPAMVMVKGGPHQQIRLINQAGEAMLGLKADDAVGKRSSDFFRPEKAAYYDHCDHKALHSEDTIVLEEEYFRDSTGQERILQLKKTAIRNSDGVPEAVLTLGIDLTERKKAEAQIAQLAHYDPLTGLGNRILFANEMERALSRIQRQSRSIALLCLDLDRFKAVNDSFGHMIGDQLLIQVAERLRQCLRKSDFAARMGGDEFAIIQEISTPSDAELLAERLTTALRKPFHINGTRLDIAASIGISLAPQDGMDIARLQSRADLAMYRAKAEGRDGWRVFRADMDAQVQYRLEMERDLKTALRESQFTLHFQPIMNLNSQDVVSFETLLRWTHPKKGAISPADFIPIAEETGLIVPIGEYVLRQACKAAAQWPVPWRVAVNVSAVQFRNKALIDQIRDALVISGLDPKRLELEITESAILENREQNLALLQQVCDMGVRIAMDDFGTGYSSLSYLRIFPLDKIKIDQSFVRDLPHDRNAASIIRAICDMAESLDIQITAEGVETADQMEALRQLKCHEVQGYLIGRPAAEVTPYVSAPLRLSA